LNNQAFFGLAWTITAVFALLIIVLSVTFFGYRKSDYFLRHPVAIGDVIWKNFWMFVVAGLIEFIFFMKIATKFTPVPPSALIQYLIQAIQTELGVESGMDECPQGKIKAKNGENCQNLWLCPTDKNELIAKIVVGVVFLSTVLAIMLQPTAFPFLETLQPSVYEQGIQMETFSPQAHPGLQSA
jgi:hypothetical protein